MNHQILISLIGLFLSLFNTFTYGYRIFSSNPTDLKTSLSPFKSSMGSIARNELRQGEISIQMSSNVPSETPKSLKSIFSKRFSAIVLGAVSSLGLLMKVSATPSTGGYPIYGEESIMSKKSHGTSDKPVQTNLRWNCDVKIADKICNFNRHFAEYSGYFTMSTLGFLKELREKSNAGEVEPITFYDSVTGKPLFKAPVGRSYDDFISESLTHGWPSFRDNEVVWDNVRALKGGETVSITGTHLGHNLPDSLGNRYCINLVSIAGNPEKS